MLLWICFVFCKAQFYDAGFPDRSQDSCLCADRVELSRPLPMKVEARWAPDVPPDKRVYILEKPKFPHFDLEREAGEYSDD